MLNYAEQVGDFQEDDTLKTLQDVTDAYHYWIEDGDEAPSGSACYPWKGQPATLKRLW